MIPQKANEDNISQKPGSNTKVLPKDNRRVFFSKKYKQFFCHRYLDVTTLKCL